MTVSYVTETANPTFGAPVRMIGEEAQTVGSQSSAADKWRFYRYRIRSRNPASNLGVAKMTAVSIVVPIPNTGTPAVRSHHH